VSLSLSLSNKIYLPAKFWTVKLKEIAVFIKKKLIYLVVANFSTKHRIKKHAEN